MKLGEAIYMDQVVDNPLYAEVGQAGDLPSWAYEGFNDERPSSEYADTSRTRSARFDGSTNSVSRRSSIHL